MNPIIEINRNRYARLVEDQMKDNGNYKESLKHFDEILALLNQGTEMKYLENPDTNAIYCEARLVISQLDESGALRLKD